MMYNVLTVRSDTVSFAIKGNTKEIKAQIKIMMKLLKGDVVQ